MKKYTLPLLGLLLTIGTYKINGAQDTMQLTLFNNLGALVDFIQNTPLNKQIDFDQSGNRFLNRQIKQSWQLTIQRAMQYVRQNNTNVFGQVDATISQAIIDVNGISNRIILWYNNVIEYAHLINSQTKATYTRGLTQCIQELNTIQQKLIGKHRTTSKQNAQIMLNETISSLRSIAQAIINKF